ncbi:MAG: hypothetical protein ACXVCX_16020, partial [Ktedonobacterales bacterium]
IDAVRCAKLAKDAGLGGALVGPSAYFMKSPAIQYTDEQARLLTEEFIREYGRSNRDESAEAHLQAMSALDGHAAAGLA